MTGLMGAAFIGPAPTKAADPDLLAQWTFDAGSGTTVEDASGNGHTGVITGGATWLPTGGIGGSGAMEFDGVDGLVTVPASSALEPSSLTVMAWVNGIDPGFDYRMPIVAKGDSGACGAASWDLFASPGDYGGGTLQGALARQAGQDPYGWMAKYARLFDGAWHLVAFTYGEADGTARWYVDGREGMKVVGTPLTYGLAAGDDLTIGGTTTECNWNRPFTGAIDDVRVYGRALTAAEIDDFVADVETSTAVEFPSGPLTYQQQHVTFPVTVSPPPSGGGLATLYRMVDGSPVAGTTWEIDPLTGKGVVKLIESGMLPEGDYDVYVAFHDGGTFKDSRTATQTLQIRREPNPVSLTADRSTVYVGQSLQLTATATEYTTSIAFWDAVDGQPAAFLGAITPYGLSDGSQRADFTIEAPSLGVHHYTAVAAPNEAYLEGSSPERVVPVVKRPTATHIGYDGIEQTNHPFVIYVQVNAQEPQEYPTGATGTITLRDGPSTIASAPIADGGAEFQVPYFALGTHVLTATYSGDAAFAGSTVQTPLTIVADSVEATGVGAQYATFYPYRDGYRDKVALSGTRLEPASVGIRIYAASGKLVRKATISRDEGRYTYAWNGRTDAGTILAAGTYRVAQKLTDANGNSRTWTSYVKLSTKRLVTRTTYVSKQGSSVAAKSANGTGSARVSTSAGTVRLKAGSGGAAAGWELRVPSATVYLSVSFQVRSTAVLSAPPNWIGVQNFRDCARASGDWYSGCFDHWDSIGDSSSAYSWSSTTTKSSANRSGRYVRGLLLVNTGTVTVNSVRLKVKYQVLQ